MTETSNIVQQAEITGGVILPSVAAFGYGVYLLLAIDSHSSNGLLLSVFGALSFFSAFLATRWPIVSWLTSGLGWYTFGIIGCIGLGVAIAERAEWSVAAANLFWLLFGLYVLNRAGHFRRFVLAGQ